MFHIASISNPTGGSVAFNNIPQTFNHLQLRIFMRTTFNSTNENLFLRFNNATYSFAGHGLTGNGSSASSASYTGINYMDANVMATNSYSSGVFASYIVDILDYSNTNKNKTVKFLGGFDANGSGFVSLNSGLLPSTSAITDISQIGGTATAGFVSGSRFDLYGITTSSVTGA
jgi:hypothetical protein